MIAATNYQQHRSDERRGGGSPVAAVRARHTHAADDKAHDRPRRYSSARSGLILPVKLGRGLRAPALSRVGWCFNTARDFIEFDRLTKSGVHPLHAIAAMSPVLPADQTVTIEPGLLQPIAELSHSSVPSAARVLDDRESDRARGRKIGTSVQRA